MQRRKLVGSVKTKPKLVLDRQQHHSIHCEPQNKSFPISVVRIIENKQNHKFHHQVPSDHSLQKIKRRSSSIKQTNFNIRPLPIKTEPSPSEAHLLPTNPPPLPPGVPLTLEEFLEQLAHKVCISPQVFYISGDLTLSCSLFTRIAQTIIEEIGYNKHALHQVIEKISAFVVGPKEETEECHSKRDITSDSKGKVQVFTISKEVEINLANSQYSASSLSSGSSLQQPSSPPTSLSSEPFLFSHLCDLEEYIFNQSNKILHEAVRRHKYLEEELFAYADFLSISRVGSNVYTPETNICSLEAQLDREMRELNRELVQGEWPLERKGRIMRDYVLRVRESYTGLIDELIGVIDRKTEQAKNFVDKVIKWEQNYLTRKEYLGNLKKDYCLHFQTLIKSLIHLSQGEPVSAVLSTIEESLAAIHRIFLLGNSFY